ncbi:MAG: flavoprotein [Kiritimatiellia bacterium]
MNVLLGVTGAIACYKVCSLVRLMVQAGWQVRVVLTERAEDFVGEITWRTLSQHVVERSAFAPSDDWHPRHIALAEWCDVLMVAPASANTLAKLAQGFADNLLTQTALACTKPLVLVPAMNTHMWEHPATQASVACLLQRGAQMVDPETGDLACGTRGTGRLPEPEVLLKALERYAK